MKKKYVIYVILAILIVTVTLYGSYSYYENKSKEEVLYNLRIHRESVEEIQSRLLRLEEDGLVPEEKEVVFLAHTLLAKQSYMIGTKLLNDHEDHHQRFQDSFVEFNEQLHSSVSNGDTEEVYALIADYKREINEFREDIKSS